MTARSPTASIRFRIRRTRSSSTALARAAPREVAMSPPGPRVARTIWPSRCLTTPGRSSFMLDLTRPIDVPGFPQARVYRDHHQERTYYAVPWTASVAIDPSGRPECRLLLFVKHQDGASVATGGQLSLTTTLS